MAKLKTLKPAVARMSGLTCPPPEKRADTELQTSAHAKWAETVKARAGYRCQAIDDGHRCEVAAPARLFADHIIERRDGGTPLDPANGQCLCGRHHTLKTTAARAARLSEKL